jgi:hypothetical protein
MNGLAPTSKEYPMRAVSTGLVMCLFSVLSLPSAAAAAGAQWLVPEPATAEKPCEIVVRLFDGEPFDGEERPFARGEGVIFQRVWKSGRAGLDKSGGRFSVERPGVQLIGYGSPASGDYCKALVVVGDAGRGDPLRYSEMGQRLEIVPQSDPVVLLEGGGRLELQVLFEREPLAGVVVRAIPQDDPAGGVLKARTDEIGLVDFALDRSGLWMIAVEKETLSATLVLMAGGG